MVTLMLHTLGIPDEVNRKRETDSMNRKIVAGRHFPLFFRQE